MGRAVGPGGSDGRQVVFVVNGHFFAHWRFSSGVRHLSFVAVVCTFGALVWAFGHGVYFYGGRSRWQYSGNTAAPQLAQCGARRGYFWLGRSLFVGAAFSVAPDQHQHNLFGPFDESCHAFWLLPRRGQLDSCGGSRVWVCGGGCLPRPHRGSEVHPGPAATFRFVCCHDSHCAGSGPWAGHAGGRITRFPVQVV